MKFLQVFDWLSLTWPSYDLNFALYVSVVFLSSTLSEGAFADHSPYNLLMSFMSRRQTTFASIGSYPSSHGNIVGTESFTSL